MLWVRSWVYNYLCNQYLSPLTLWVWIPLRRTVLHATLYDKACQWLATGLWFSPGTLVSSTKTSDHHYIIEILLKVALNTINLTHYVVWTVKICLLWFPACLLWIFEYKGIKRGQDTGLNGLNPILDRAMDCLWMMNYTRSWTSLLKYKCV